MVKNKFLISLFMLVATIITINTTQAILGHRFNEKIGTKITNNAATREFNYNAQALKAPQAGLVHVVYHPGYNISFYGIEKLLHHFDGQKYGKIITNLGRFNRQALRVSDELQAKPFCISNGIQLHTPKIVSNEDLLLCHTPQYLKSLNYSKNVARIAEIPLLGFVPNYFLQKKLLNPMLLATGGTILGAELALKNGCAINLSGGYHHAKSANGEGFCFYADIPIAIKKLWQKNPNLRVMIIDLDAHQGNGIEAILKDDPRIHIVDMYNCDVYPRDSHAARFIKTNIPVHSGIKDEQYLRLLTQSLTQALESMEAKPDLIIYNAGSDIFEKDPLGHMSVSRAGIIKRDSFVFDSACKYNIPLLMVLSGGYTKESADIISESICTIIGKRN